MFNLIWQTYLSLNKTERYFIFGLILIMSASAAAWSMLIIQSATIKIPVESNLYREGAIGQPIAVNPVIAGNNDMDRDLVELLFANLTKLTESYKASPDGQVWNITLKEGLKWSDDKPLTSDDVIFTIDAIQNSDSRSPLFLTWQGVVAERISQKEVEFTLRAPYGFFLDNLKNFKIIPKHIFGVIPIENFRLSSYNLEPVGSGPYKFISFEKKKDGFITSYHLAANENYSSERTLLKEFEIKFFPDSSSLIDAFNSGKIDGFGGLNPKNIGSLKLNHQLITKLMPQYYAIFINKSAKTSLADAGIVKAMNLATDKKRIIESVFDGYAAITNQPILPFMEGYDAKADSASEFSIEKAVAILDEGKWQINKETGIREKKIGRQTEVLDFSIIVPQIPFLTETVGIIKEDFQKIGINLNPIVLSPSDIANEVIKTRNYQMLIFGNILRNNPDIFSFWHSSERFYPGLNLSLYSNKKADSLLESVRRDLDQETRKENLAVLQETIANDQPAIFLYSPAYIYVAPKDFGGFEENIIATPSDRFQNINKWYLKTSRVFK